MKIFLTATLCCAATLAAKADIVATEAYRWEADTIFQGPFKAFAPSETEIISDYAAAPGYFMPVEKQWALKNDISAFPRLKTPNRLHTAIYNMGLDEMVNAVEPDTTLRTGKEWAGVWTRDVSYSIILSMAYLQPEASRISLMKKVDSLGRIIQDTGSGGAWPVSTDREIWAVAAWEVYLATGDRQWLEFIYPVIKKSVDTDLATVHRDGAVDGETSFIDWREQSYPKWMQTADIFASQAHGTSVVHTQAVDILSRIARLLGHTAESEKYARTAQSLKESVNAKFWNPEKGLMDMYTYGRTFPISNPRSETLGQSLAIIFGQTGDDRALQITQNIPVTPFGPAIFYPQIADMPPYHNNALWPFVAAYYTLANAEAGNEQGVLEGIGSIFRPAALFATNKENFVLDNGDIATELNSSNMLWSLAGNIAVTHRVLFGLRFTPEGLRFYPAVPRALAATRTLENLRYHGATVNVTVNGWGNRIASATVNGIPTSVDNLVIPFGANGHYDVDITMDNAPFPTDKINRCHNAKSPLTPITRFSADQRTLEWNPIEYIAGYIVLRDGKEIATTRSTTFDASEPGEYQVIGVSSEGIRSFASEPLSNRTEIAAQPYRETNKILSREASYLPDHDPLGAHSGGFAETDHSTAPLTFKAYINRPGPYAIRFRYANGNGPVNTENKCAVRSAAVNGYPVATVALPQRGVANWDDWGYTNTFTADLKKGLNTITLSFNPDVENMNIATNHALVDEVILTPLD